jgi:uncharacterized protein (DUF58 family)
MRDPLQVRKAAAAATKKRAADPTDPRVYVSLEQLVLLRAQATGFSFLPRQPVHSLLTGKHGSRLRGRGLNFEEIRTYQPGDDIRNMDWKVTARTHSPHVRVYSEERDRTVLLIVDQRIHMFFGSTDKMKSVSAAELAALAIWRVLAMGDRIGGIVFNDREHDCVQPRRSETTAMELLNHVVRMNRQLTVDAPAGDSSRLNAALEKASRMAAHDTLVIIISDFEGADDRTLELTTRMAEHNDLLGLHLYDLLRAAPRQAGAISLTDGQRQISADFNDARFRKKIATDYQQESAELVHTLRKLSAPLLPISTQGEVADQIRKLLGNAPKPH